jgi:hypothetical protein
MRPTGLIVEVPAAEGLVGDTRQREIHGRLVDDWRVAFPIRCRAIALSLFVCDDDDLWTRQHVFEFSPAK